MLLRDRVCIASLLRKSLVLLQVSIMIELVSLYVPTHTYNCNVFYLSKNSYSSFWP